MRTCLVIFKAVSTCTWTIFQSKRTYLRSNNLASITPSLSQLFLGGGGEFGKQDEIFFTLSLSRLGLGGGGYLAYRTEYFLPFHALGINFLTTCVCMILLFSMQHAIFNSLYVHDTFILQCLYAWNHFGIKSPTPPQKLNGLHVREK